MGGSRNSNRVLIAWQLPKPGSGLAQRSGPGVTPGDAVHMPRLADPQQGKDQCVGFFKNSQERDSWLPRSS
jgi:hypothetical protein